jgi:hypothetical protein
MKLEDIQEQWAKDADIDRTELGHVSLSIPKLHNRYYKIYSNERLRLRKLETELKELKRDKYEFYLDGPTHEQIDKGWEMPAKGRILKTDVPQYMESDKHIIDMNLKIAYQMEKVEYVESILKTISQMNWIIKNAIDWEKFKVGA